MSHLANTNSSRLTKDTDWSEPTTYLQRFTHALSLLCGQTPPEEIVLAWLDKNIDDFRLQEFAIAHGPAWAQGIVLIEAAQLMADQPTEGVEHEQSPDLWPESTATEPLPEQQSEEDTLAQKWKEIAEFQHALRHFPFELDLGQGALDAYAQNWPGYQGAIDRELAKRNSAEKRTEFIKPPKQKIRSQAEDASDEGYHAYMDDKHISENPYVNGCENYNLWQRGYLTAQTDECT